MAEITDRELTHLWRTEQVLHAVARVMLRGQLSAEVLGFERLAVCECAEGVQALAAKIQRKQVEKGTA
ncbi:MAG: hypothetical protein GWN58_08985 [Anaerolineae bacterium]|nr:hypothetical protein [Anaerolineae bacterium]